MKTFDSIEIAFEYFLKEVLPTLPKETQKVLDTTKRNFFHDKSRVSERKMISILKEYLKVEIVTKVIVYQE